MLDRLEEIERRYHELGQQMALPEVVFDLEQLQRLARERANIEDLVTKYQECKATINSLQETTAMLSDGLDEDMTALVKQEIETLETRREQLLHELKLALLPKDASDEREIIMEINILNYKDKIEMIKTYISDFQLNFIAKIRSVYMISRTLHQINLYDKTISICYFGNSHINDYLIILNKIYGQKIKIISKSQLSDDDNKILNYKLKFDF